MIRRLLAPLRRRRRPLLLALAALVVLANVLAFMHAWSMTHFAAGGVLPPGPQQMSSGQKVRTVLFGLSVPRPTNRVTPAVRGLSFDTVRFPTSDGLQLEAWHIRREDARGMVVLFHGYASAKSAVLREAAAFREMGYDTLLVDFRGSGGSDGNVTTIGWDEAADVAAAVEHAHRHYQPRELILYAQSMGASAVLRAFAAHHVSPDGLILEVPFDRLLTTITNRFEWMHVPSFPFARMMVFWGGIQHGHWMFAMNPMNDASFVKCPTLYLRGADDPWVTEGDTQRVFDRLAGPKRLVTLPDVGHEACMGRHPERWVAAVSEFLGQSRAPASLAAPPGPLEPREAELRQGPYSTPARSPLAERR